MENQNTEELGKYSKGKLPAVDENISQETSSRKKTAPPREKRPQKEDYKVPATDRPRMNTQHTPEGSEIKRDR